MLVLGIETSCDETAAAVVRDGSELLSNAVSSSMDLHAAYGGVVPEIAARSHIEVIMPVIQQALDQAGCSWSDIDAIAVTQGAGLGGSLMIGVLTARTIAHIKHKPLYAANHVLGHLYVNFLTQTTLPGLTMPKRPPQFPILGIIVSGGHSQLALFESHLTYRLLGQTKDDAIGEAFDKVGKILGLPYPGGPSISKASLDGDAHKYSFPKARLTSKYDFSFSGLKTAVLREAQKLAGSDHTLPSFEIAARLTPTMINDLAASFQRTAAETIVDKAVEAEREFSPASVIVGGGVAANQELRIQLASRLTRTPEYADLKLCTDNAAMIATLGFYMAKNGTSPVDARNLQPEPSLAM